MFIGSVEKIKAADIINTANQLKRYNLNETNVNLVVHSDHISIVDPKDNRMLAYIKRDSKSTG